MSFAGRKVQGINVEHVSHDTETFSYEDRGTNEEVSSRDPQKTDSKNSQGTLFERLLLLKQRTTKNLVLRAFKEK